MTESRTALCVFTRKFARNFRSQNQVCSHLDCHRNLIPRIYLRRQSEIKKSVKFLEPEVDLMYARESGFDHHWNLIPRIYLRRQSGMLFLHRNKKKNREMTANLKLHFMI